jgi:hypothetical protein
MRRLELYPTSATRKASLRALGVNCREKSVQHQLQISAPALLTCGHNLAVSIDKDRTWDRNDFKQLSHRAL